MGLARRATDIPFSAPQPAKGLRDTESFERENTAIMQSMRSRAGEPGEQRSEGVAPESFFTSGGE